VTTWFLNTQIDRQKTIDADCNASHLYQKKVTNCSYLKLWHSALLRGVVCWRQCYIISYFVKMFNWLLFSQEEYCCPGYFGIDCNGMYPFIASMVINSPVKAVFNKSASILLRWQHWCSPLLSSVPGTSSYRSISAARARAALQQTSRTSLLLSIDGSTG